MKDTIGIHSKTSAFTRTLRSVMVLLFLITPARAFASACTANANCIDDSDLFPAFRFVQTNAGHVVVIAVATVGVVAFCFTKRGSAVRALGNFALGSTVAAALLGFLVSFS
ncbi:MAG: hypothetical protein ACLQU2_02945 [Candidatus Binataceae bacterium]